MITSLDYDVAGTSIHKVTRLMMAVAAAAENRWDGHKDGGYKLVGTVGGIRLHLVEKGRMLSLRGDGWMIELLCGWGSGTQFRLPATAGQRLLPDSKADSYSGVIHDVQIKSANAFRHDMTILLMFEGQWES